MMMNLKWPQQNLAMREADIICEGLLQQLDEKKNSSFHIPCSIGKNEQKNEIREIKFYFNKTDTDWYPLEQYRGLQTACLLSIVQWTIGCDPACANISTDFHEHSTPGGEVGGVRPCVVGHGVGQVVAQVLDGALASHDRLDEETEHRKHSQTPVLDLLHL